MSILTKILFWIAFAAATTLGLRYYTHMLQLSSYQFQGYFRFLRSKPQRYGLHIGFLCVYAIAGFIADTHMITVLTWISFAFLVFLVIQYLPKKAKKKFVVTKRVSRLFVTYVLLFAVVVILYFALPNAQYVLAIYMGFLPLVVALTNLINKPVEKKINDWYIKDAQRILNEHPNLKIIGITGSYGKTSVKYYICTLLAEGFRVLMTPESFNTPMGIIRTIRGDLTPMHEIFICEMGARHVHDIKEITDIVHPDDGIVTSIGPQHLETFHSMENIINTKFELLDAVDEKSSTGLKFVNGDDVNIMDNLRYKDAITYGTSEKCDYRATDINFSKDGASFKVTTPSGETCDFTMKLLGEHNVTNVVGAIAMANKLGIPLKKLQMAVRRLVPAPHRQELKKHGNVTIIDDAYNANPNGAKRALDTLSKFKDSVRILVTPGMVELGEKEDEFNKEFGKQAASSCDYMILVGGDHVRPIREGALEAGFSEDKLFVKETLDSAVSLMYEIDAGKQKVILLENDLPDNYT
ncbi:MAG: UDP-N-acetylmuramoyl-tripeptide--D-alanyl-D-alanine ligase [Butyrivibrio sp.]|nr:UDP-N-acetylmuramoyl-tripeptide--D-alanyl-D-alanine ligase [Butyrivibrio sp.]